jgi:CheY-like chemotaxis protein
MKLSMQTVLLIDDQPAGVKYYVKALKDAGFDVVTLTSADEAWDYFTNFRPEIAAVILDIIMAPGAAMVGKDHKAGTMTGVFLFERILDLQEKSRALVPVGVMTQSTDKQVFDALVEIQKRHRPLEQFQLWSKVSLTPGAFIEQFKEWLGAVESLYNLKK